MKRARIEVAVALLLSGCGGSSGGVPTSSASYRDYAAAMAQSVCEATFRCCSAVQAAAKYKDLATCVTMQTAAIDSAATESSIKAGAVVYDAVAGGACISAAQSQFAKCDGPNESAQFSTSCSVVLVGTTKAGDHCGDTAPCGINSYCYMPGQAGICKLAGNAGDACAHSIECGPGLGCLSAKCGALAADGAACTSGDQCLSGSCTNTACAAAATVRTALCN